MTEHRSFRVGPGRRAVDVAASAVLVVVTAPLVLVAALLILLTDGRPVLFRQERVGEDGVPFRLAKLRTMRAAPPGGATEVTATGDPRITRLGAALRRTSIDELPQLWHVLTGRMTLVGPRPESVALASRYPERCRPVLRARPGLTGPAQLRYREASAVPPPGWTDVEGWYLDVVVPLRVEADLEYLRRPTLGATLRLLVVTALFVVGLADVQATARQPEQPARQRAAEG
jgi:lipopolysaccharide/colanic/teichoic acid biosynthesis glycosyltransferase